MPFLSLSGPVIAAILIAGALAAGAAAYWMGRSDANLQHERQAVRQDTENREVRDEVDRRLLADPDRTPVVRERWTRD